MSGSVSKERCALLRGFGGSISQIYARSRVVSRSDTTAPRETHLHLVVVRPGHERELDGPMVPRLQVVVPNIEDESLRVGGGRLRDPCDDRRQHDPRVRRPRRGLLEL